MEFIILRKLFRISAEKFLAISFTIISLSITTTRPSLSEETKIVNASRADIILYRQIFTNYFCNARQSKVKFDEAFSLAAKNLTAIIINKHGGLLEELDGKKITNNQLLNGSTNIIMESAILTCPNQVPEKMKKDFKKSIEEQTKSLEKTRENN
tara:strand:+ start:235 stop:696 length:462 start_codon:yes stop_codon:yes gene_type:complete